MEGVVQATVVFLKDREGRICLARKKQPIHNETGEISYSLGMWNGYGGKREAEDAHVEDTAIRELFDESSVFVEKEDLVYLGKSLFCLSKNEEVTPFMKVFFYEASVYEGVPKEGDEMGAPQFFTKEDIPYDEMMPADKALLPKMFEGEILDAKVTLYGKDVEPKVEF